MGATDASVRGISGVRLFAFALLLAACGGSGDGGARSGGTPVPPLSSIALKLERIDAGLSLNFPLFLTAPPGDSARLFVVEKGGVIKVVNRPTHALIGIFLNITSLVSTGGEQGLLGLAFDPQYASNRRFYVSYTDTSGTSVVARYLADPMNPNVAQSTADRIILTVAQPFANHNGGMIAFGPDGYLYLGYGDGGSGGDPGNRAQNRNELLGKLLRIDVSQANPSLPAYAIPSDNPFVGQAAAVRKEIWAYGLRNPWRFSFDRQSQDLYIADVGQVNWEEVDVSTMAGGAGKGTNYGWKVMEGNHCYPPGTACNMAGLTLPVIEYDHSSGNCSITGGYVYRGAALPAVRGTYFYADYCTGFVRSFRFVNGAATDQADWPSLRPGGSITSFGEDAAGEIYIMTDSGGLFRIVAN